MKAYRFIVFADKDNIKQLRIHKEIRDNRLNGIEVDIDEQTKQVTVDELENSYRITWYDKDKSIMGRYGVGQRIYQFWEEYIEKHNLRGVK